MYRINIFFYIYKGYDMGLIYYDKSRSSWMSTNLEARFVWTGINSRSISSWRKEEGVGISISIASASVVVVESWGVVWEEMAEVIPDIILPSVESFLRWWEGDEVGNWIPPCCCSSLRSNSWEAIEMPLKTELCRRWPCVWLIVFAIWLLASCHASNVVGGRWLVLLKGAIFLLINGCSLGSKSTLSRASSSEKEIAVPLSALIDNAGEYIRLVRLDVIK